MYDPIVPDGHPTTTVRATVVFDADARHPDNLNADCEGKHFQRIANWKEFFDYRQREAAAKLAYLPTQEVTEDKSRGASSSSSSSRSKATKKLRRPKRAILYRIRISPEPGYVIPADIDWECLEDGHYLYAHPSELWMLHPCPGTPYLGDRPDNWTSDTSDPEISMCFIGV